MNEVNQHRMVTSDNTVTVFLDHKELVFHFRDADERDSFLCYLNNCIEIEVKSE